MYQDISRRITAEFFGTFWLTFGGCGVARNGAFLLYCLTVGRTLGAEA
jgi:glycerol uptake facilitator-like aquaporin